LYNQLIKPLLDSLLALFILAFLAPVILLVTLVLWFAHGRKSIFFIQPRPGKHNKIFRLVKFKTMNDKRNINGELLPDIQRLTPIGKFVRKTSLDELPQLVNVLKGEMSLVGPRPLLVEYLNLYTEKQMRRHEVKPGITGWAQVNGRNAISWEEKFKLDVWYVDHISIGLDLKILFLTIKKVIVRDGISAEGHATMDYFKGSKELNE